MAWRRIGDKPLSEPMLTQFTDAYMRHFLLAWNFIEIQMHICQLFSWHDLPLINIDWCPSISRTWWHHQMVTFSALLPLHKGNSLVTGEFPSQRPVMLIFDVFFDLRLDKRFSKQSRRRWFETPSHALWCHCNELAILLHRESALQMIVDVFFVICQNNQLQKQMIGQWD